MEWFEGDVVWWFFGDENYNYLLKDWFKGVWCYLREMFLIVDDFFRFESFFLIFFDFF